MLEGMVHSSCMKSRMSHGSEIQPASQLIEFLDLTQQKYVTLEMLFKPISWLALRKALVSQEDTETTLHRAKVRVIRWN